MGIKIYQVFSNRSMVTLAGIFTVIFVVFILVEFDDNGHHRLLAFLGFSRLNFSFQNLTSDKNIPGRTLLF